MLVNPEEKPRLIVFVNLTEEITNKKPLMSMKTASSSEKSLNSTQDEIDMNIDDDLDLDLNEFVNIH